MKIPFGKFKDQFIEDLPSSYLVWLIEGDIKLKDDLYESISVELDNRFSISKRNSPANLRDVYIQLSKQYHPDKGGNTEAMKAINEFYNRLNG